MDDEHGTHHAVVRVELEDVTRKVAGEFWAALHGHEIDIGGYVAVVTQVDLEPPALPRLNAR